MYTIKRRCDELTRRIWYRGLAAEDLALLAHLYRRRIDVNERIDGGVQEANRNAKGRATGC